MTLEAPLSVVTAEMRAAAAASTLSDDDLRAYIRAVRAGRMTAAQTSARSRSTKAPINIDTMIDELESLR